MSHPAPEHSIFDPASDEAEQRALAEAEKQVADGKLISHEAVRRWLLSWGTANELPPPKCSE